MEIRDQIHGDFYQIIMVLTKKDDKFFIIRNGIKRVGN